MVLDFLLVSPDQDHNLIQKLKYTHHERHLHQLMLSHLHAFATVAFVAFISMLVDRTYTATQYALLASIGTAGRTSLAASSGALVDWLNGDWGIFFILTAIMVIPSLIFLYMIRHKLKLND